MSKRNTRRHRKNKRRQKRVRRTRKRVIHGGNLYSSVKVLNFYNKYHLGDSILNLKFFFNISDIMKSNGIYIQYYYDDEYNKKEELERFVNPETLQLFSINNKGEGAIELWMGNSIDGFDSKILDKYYNLFYNNIVKILGLQGNTIDTSLYQPEPYLQVLYNTLDTKYHNLDILIINAAPQSGQVVYHKEQFDNMCIFLNEKYNIATTSPVNDSIKCMMNDKLMLKDIGAISTHAKYIIAIHSGPVTSCFNKDTKQNVKKWVLFADNDVKHNDLNCVILKSDYDLTKIEEHLN